MDFADVVRKRRMVRSYTDQPVDHGAVERALGHAIRAPSAGFSQGWAFLLLDAPGDVRRFWRVSSPAGDSSDAWLEGMRRAPVLVVPLSCKAAYLDRYAEPDKGRTDRDESWWPAPYWDMDTAMASLLVLLSAVDQGLGACFFGVPTDRIEAFKREFGVPADHHPIGAITLGHPAAVERVGGSARTRPRRTTDQVVHRGGW